jgi:hypothetical protein
VRFQLTHKLTTYLLVLAAMATLLTANLVSPSAALLALGCGTVSWFSDPGSRLFNWLGRATVVLRLAAAGFFVLSAYQVWSRLPEPDLTPVLNLVLFLTVYKLFQRAANRDYLQIYVLAFLMVLAGAAFAQSFLFAVTFAAYVVVTTWTLILLHLRREMEENYLVKHSGNAPSHKVGVARILNSRRVIGAPFLAMTTLVALVICAGAAFTFALVPRVGTGFALGGARARKNLIGFSDEVTLGTSGFLSGEDDTVALRAVLPRLSRLGSDRDRDTELDKLYWRGTVYETYQKGRWLRAHHEALRTQLQETDGPIWIEEPHTRGKDAQPPKLADLERQEIDIVGVAAPVAFALDQPLAFELPPPKLGALADLRLIPRWSGEVAFQNTGLDGRAGDPTADLRVFSGAHYVAYSRDPFGTVHAATGRPLAEISPALLEPYLALPPGLGPRITALARDVTAGRPTAAGKVLAVMEWLDKTHEYSVDLSHRTGASDPIENFLFEQKSGHCEYFASAAALMLRAVGVPTRYVNGFLGGEWNAVGQYVTVRQNRAHAWVEAYLGELGWMRVDATPPVRAGGRMNGLRQLLDSIEFFWGRWVVGYDLGRQLDLARNLERGMGGSHGHASDARPAFAFRRLLPVIGIAALLAFGVWLHRRRRRPSAGLQGAATPIPHAVGRLYRRAVERLGQQGHRRRPSETPREYAVRMEGASIEGAAAFTELTDLYLQARFGRREIDDGRVTELARRLTKLGVPIGETSTRAA